MRDLLWPVWLQVKQDVGLTYPIWAPRVVEYHSPVWHPALDTPGCYPCLDIQQCFVLHLVGRDVWYHLVLPQLLQVL